MKKYKEFIEKVNFSFAGLSAISLIIMMIVICLDVFGRLFFNRPIYGALGLTRTLLVILIFSAIGYAQVEKTHIKVEILLKKMDFLTRKIVVICGLCFSFIVMSLMTYGTALNASQSLVIKETMAGIINFPVWPARIIISFGCLLLTLQYPADIYDNLLQIQDLKRKNKDNTNL